MKYNKADQQLIEKAISFLVSNFNSSGNNEKPVILHSLRIAFYLMENRYDVEIILSAILHDLIEDTNVNLKEIEIVFGESVSSIVSALSLNPLLDDYDKQYLEMFERCIKIGIKALLVKAADLSDNSDYYELASKDLQPKLWRKLKVFLDLSSPYIGTSKVWTDLKEKVIN